MTAVEYWNALAEKNPRFESDKIVSIPTENLKKIVLQAHKKGYASAEARNNIGGLFNEMFGGGRNNKNQR